MITKDKHGFTLIELLISLAISALILSAVYKIFTSNNLIYLKNTELAKMEQNLRSGFSMLRNDIIMAGYDPTGNYTLGIDTESSTESSIVLSYYDDVDDHNATKISYDLYDSDTYGDNTLARRKINIAQSLSSTKRQPIMSNVRSIKFTYCNENDVCSTIANNVSDIRYVTVFLETYPDRNHLNIPDLNINRTISIRNASLGN